MAEKHRMGCAALGPTAPNNASIRQRISSNVRLKDCRHDERPHSPAGLAGFREPAHAAPPQGLTCENAVHPFGEESEPLGVAAGHLSDGPAAIADVVKRLHHRRPIAVSFEQFDLGPATRVVRLGAAAFLDVHINDPFAQDANPLLGPAIADDIPHIEVPPTAALWNSSTGEPLRAG